MGLRIHTGPLLNQVGQTTQRLQQSFARLSSGKRITGGADDPAGVGIATKLSAEIDSKSVALRNIQDGISLASTAEATLSNVGSMLTRVRELAVQSQSDTLTSADLDALDTEYQALVAEITTQLDSAEFNGQSLFPGTAETISIQTDANQGDTVDIDLVDLSFVTDTLEGLDLNTALSSLVGPVADLAQAVVNGLQGEFAGVQNILETAQSSLESHRINLEATRSKIEDVDVAHESAEMVRLQILQQSGIAALAQANSHNLRAGDLLGL